MDCTVIMPQPMQHSDGYSLLGFDNWEDVNDEKLAAAVTNIMSFKLNKDRVGFHAKDSN